ncbi:MAG: metallophosphoesterase [Candidatus Lokiarchaeota archaeon]|nr:metallophosphoesterase [Candidatus Lokiarchaeota archaeon]
MPTKAKPLKSDALVLLVISAAMVAGFAVYLNVTNAISLARPRWNVPVIRTANETFTIEVESQVPITGALEMGATITSRYGDFPLLLSSIAANGNSITTTAAFPAGTVNDTLYDLEVSVNGMVDSQLHAVKVITAYKAEFKVVVWSDTQVGYSEEYESMWEDSYDFTTEVVKQTNLVNPEFVILSGDVTETAVKSDYQFIYEQCTQHLQVPIFVGPGNHDYFGTDEYKRWCRYFNFTFDYGPDYHFTYIDTGMNLDALRDQYFAWLQSDMASHVSTPVKIIAGHAPVYECQSVDEPGDINRNFDKFNEEFVALCDQYGVMAYLHGHNHQDRLTYGNCTPVAATDAPFSGTLMLQTNDVREEAAYRVLHFKDRELVNFTRVEHPNGTRHAYECLKAVARNPSTHEPDPDIPTITFSGNVSWQDGISASQGAICLIGNRYEYEDCANATIRVSIVGSDATLGGLTNATQAYISRKIPRTDVAGVITVEVNFFLANNTTSRIEVRRA